jgi:signal transduction histidine kinase
VIGVVSVFNREPRVFRPAELEMAQALVHLATLALQLNRMAQDRQESALVEERNRMAREIHDTLGHYLTVIHVQLEAARAVIGSDAERGMLAVTRAQALAKDGLTAVRQSVRALREEGSVDGIAEQIASLVDSVQDERFSVTLTISGTPRPVSAAVALALHRTTLEALTNVRKHADARNVGIELAFRDDGLVQLRVHDDGKGAARGTVGTGFGLKGIRERAEQLNGSATYRMAPDEGFTVDVELPAQPSLAHPGERAAAGLA